LIVKLQTLERQLNEAAARFVSPAEANYFAAICLETHLRKAPRMNPLEDAVYDLKVWAGAPGDGEPSCGPGEIVSVDVLK
jgi:hypothetical protein